MEKERDTARTGPRLKRTRRYGLVATGVLGGIFVAGVAVALVLVSISGSVSSNEFAVPTTTTTTTTTTTPIPSGDGLQAAIADFPSGCNDAFTAGTVALGAYSFDLNTGFASPAEKFLCVRNVGPGDITSLTVTFNTVLSEEAGCSAAEGTVDPEGATCGTDGELEDILQFALDIQGPSNGGPGSFNCRTPFAVAPGATESLLDANLFIGQGAQCEWRIQLQFAGSPTNDAKLAASTDNAQFTLDVAGSG